MVIDFQPGEALWRGRSTQGNTTMTAIAAMFHLFKIIHMLSLIPKNRAIHRLCSHIFPSLSGNRSFQPPQLAGKDERDSSLVHFSLNPPPSNINALCSRKLLSQLSVCTQHSLYPVPFRRSPECANTSPPRPWIASAPSRAPALASTSRRYVTPARKRGGQGERNVDRA